MTQEASIIDREEEPTPFFLKLDVPTFLDLLAACETAAPLLNGTELGARIEGLTEGMYEILDGMRKDEELCKLIQFFGKATL